MEKRKVYLFNLTVHIKAQRKILLQVTEVDIYVHNDFQLYNSIVMKVDT